MPPQDTKKANMDSKLTKSLICRLYVFLGFGIICLETAWHLIGLSGFFLSVELWETRIFGFTIKLVASLLCVFWGNPPSIPFDYFLNSVCTFCFRLRPPSHSNCCCNQKEISKCSPELKCAFFAARKEAETHACLALLIISSFFGI